MHEPEKGVDGGALLLAPLGKHHTQGNRFEEGQQRRIAGELERRATDGLQGAGKRQGAPAGCLEELGIQGLQALWPENLR
jgi:hypothetical protein